MLKFLLFVILIFITGCGSKHIGIKESRPLSLSTESSSNLYQYAEDNVSSHVPKSGFYPLEHHLDSMAARLLLAKAAKHRITVQYFTFYGDIIGTVLTKALIDAADRGVQVDVLIDDIDISYDNVAIGLINSHPNIKVRVFNPTNSRRALHYVEMGIYHDTVGRRMHNKSFIADNSMSVIGGRNIGDMYFALDKKNFFVDNDVLVVGPLVNQISNQFDYYFGNAYSVDFDVIAKGNIDDIDNLVETFNARLKGEGYLLLIKAMEDREFYKEFQRKQLHLFYGYAELFFDMPRKVYTDVNNTSSHLKSHVPKKIYAKKRFYMVSPYFIPNENMMQRLQKMRGAGVDVAILTNSLESSDQTTVYAYYAEYQKRLLSMGVRLYEIHPYAFEELILNQSYNLHKEMPKVALHAKTIVIDNTLFAIGSVNMDPRSRNLNTELVAVINSQELNTYEADLFNILTSPENAYELSLEYDEDHEAKVVWKATIKGKERTFYNDGDASMWLRLEKNMSLWFPIRDLL